MSVEVQIEVCDGQTCFVAPVPETEVTVEFDNANARSAKTGSNGVAEFPITTVGSANVKAQWGKLTQTAHTQLNDGSQTMTMRFLQPAVVSR